MSLWSRFANLVRGDKMSREIDEELDSHIAEAMDRGRDPAEARKALGSRLRLREESRDAKLNPWLDSLRSDAVFGWRQIKKNKTVSAAAILSLGLAIGACTTAFRLIDALLLRPLPISEPGRLHALLRQGTAPDGTPRVSDSYEYPLFQQMRAVVKGNAELIAVSYASSTDLTFGSDQEMEKGYRQYVSGWMFDAFGLRPAAGRLLSEQDDLTPGGHPYAVLSYDYWTRRFGQDQAAVGKALRIGNDLYEIVGVAEAGFTGTEPGTLVDIFVPTMMNVYGVTHDDTSWFRAFVRLEPGVMPGPIRDRMQTVFRAVREERAKGFSGRPPVFVERFLAESLLVEPAPTGISDMQKEYGGSLAALGVLVLLVLLIACSNVANLMTAQGAARAREMALRVATGAGRKRLIQLVLVESAWIALLSAALGGMLAWKAAPLIVGMINPANNPASLDLPLDWRVSGFGLVLTLAVTFVFGLGPALRASSVRPAAALKGGLIPRSRRRSMHALVALQTSFCFIVLFIGGLFLATFDRLSHQPTGFSAERLLTLDTVAASPQPVVYWNQVVDRLRAMPGVEAAGLARWTLLSGNGMNGFVSVNGAPAEENFNYFLNVSPGWAETMKISLTAGRDFTPNDVYPGAAIVNETFAKQYFGGENPVGRSFEKVEQQGRRLRFEIVGLTRDARYRNFREPIIPTIYVPLQGAGGESEFQTYTRGTFIVRTASVNPLALAQTLREAVSQTRSELRVSNIRTQEEINASHTVRERLLALLAIFFASAALMLAGVGLYGVLRYTVLQQRREIGIRMAIGAQKWNVVRGVAAGVFAAVALGGVAGLALSMGAAKYVESLLYEVNANDPMMLAIPALAILAAVLLAAAPAIVRAVRIDPATTLRSE